MVSSLERLLRERVSSPLYSTFTVTWVLSNWKIFYLTIFVSADIITPRNKIEYIIQNYFDWCHLLLYPIASTIFLLFALPYAEKEVYKSYLKFKNGRQKLREQMEANKLLTIEESTQMQLDMLEQDDIHRRQIQRKDEEIRIRQPQLQQLQDEKKRLRILYAGYGVIYSSDGFKDVTNDLIKELQRSPDNTLRFNVENNSFSISDPKPGALKDFLLVFEANGEVKNVRGVEHDSFSLSQTESIHRLQTGGARRL
ncbi:MAG: hypothetical protein QM734_16025 [Cyclobacteriaceae bacterium]